MLTRLEHAKGLYLEGIRDGDLRGALERHTGDRYRQHSTGVPDGREGFIEFFEDFLARNPKREVEIIRGIEDGHHIFVQAFQSLNAGEAQWVTMDFFDTDDGNKLIEHWDVIAPYTARTPSGHTSIDGSTEIRDRAHTDANKAVVRDLIERALINKDVGAIDEHIDPNTYIQHSKDVPDGRSAFRELAARPAREFNVQEIVLLVGEGNFVATLCKANWQDTALCQADLFRLDGGLIVEHWDASEPVPPRAELKNSGKF